MLKKNQDERLRSFVVWVPKVGGTAKDVPEATRFVSDKRAGHYWDEGGNLMAKYTAVLELPEDAWDIYMVYGPAARWEGQAPPKPDFWMHQLGSNEKPRVNGPYLDPDVFATKVNGLLAQPLRE